MKIKPNQPTNQAKTNTTSKPSQYKQTKATRPNKQSPKPTNLNQTKQN